MVLWRGGQGIRVAIEIRFFRKARFLQLAYALAIRARIRQCQSLSDRRGRRLNLIVAFS